MHYWRSVLTHTSFLLAQPAYLTVRYLVDHESFTARSYLNLAIHAAVWGCVVTRISIPFFTSPLRRLPSPPGEKWPLCHLNFNGGRPPTTIFENMINSTPNDGILVVWLPLYLGCEIIITRPDTIMEVVNSHNYDWEKPSLIKKALAGILGPEGLTHVEGNQHKAMRRIVAPAFSGRLIRDLCPLFYAKGVALTDAMARQMADTSDGVLELMGFMSRVTLDIIGEAGVGMDFNTIEREDSRLAKLYNLLSNPPAFSLLLMVLFPKWFLRQLKGTVIARTIEAQWELRKEIGALLREKKTHRSGEKSTEHNKDIIASIMDSGDFSDDYLVSQMLTFLAAGHDTTAGALVWATWLISLNPQIQNRLHAECDAHLANKPTAEVNASTFDAQKMPFLAAVCNETLRLYPPAPGTARHSIVRTTIGNVPIPVGINATIPVWAINRSCELWGADAAEFKPDRWLEGPNAANGGSESPYALLTFLHGPRSCIGQSFARLEMKCLLAALFTRFKFEVAEPERKVEIGGFVTIKPEGGLKFKVHDRKETNEVQDREAVAS